MLIDIRNEYSYLFCETKFLNILNIRKCPLNLGKPHINQFF